MFKNPRYWVLGLLIITLMVWVGCGGDGDAADTPAPADGPTAATQAAAPPVASTEPIKIGLLHPHTGALAGLGLDMTSGYKHYFEEAGHGNRRSAHRDNRGRQRGQPQRGAGQAEEAH